MADGTVIPGSSRFRFKLLLEQVDAERGSMALVMVFPAAPPLRVSYPGGFSFSVSFSSFS